VLHNTLIKAIYEPGLFGRTGTELLSSCIHTEIHTYLQCCFL